jgi:hypothetical protein
VLIRATIQNPVAARQRAAAHFLMRSTSMITQKMKRLTQLLGVGLCLMLSSLLAFAQSDNTQLSGIVKD